ncbi:MAG: PD-(D/E)XK nuclease family protein [Acidobacteria bacterium]|nr:PD-(D/E)XK nuclease family protein [Acidobacteriota bacterium]
MRVPDLQAFRRAVAELACGGTPVDVRDRLVVVPTRAAAAYLTMSIERRLGGDAAVVLPDFVTRGDLCERFGERLPRHPPLLRGVEREALMGLACRTATGSGIEPPFRLRPGLIAEIVRFYDTLQLNLKQVDTFERLALGVLEPGAADDRGAERLAQQTRFLAAAFREFERLTQESPGIDEHRLRRQLMAEPAPRPWRHVVVAVGDRAWDLYGLYPADWDLLARIPGLERLDIVATDATVAGAVHERIHQLLPGVEEIRHGPAEASARPLLLAPPGGGPAHVARDREEEVALFARLVRRDRTALDRTALVVCRPLPYVYVAREVLRSAGIPSQMFDALPLAAEPFAAVLDLVIAAVAGNFARGPALALLRSPHLECGERPPAPRDLAALDRALSEAGYLGGIEALDRLIAAWDEGSGPPAGAGRAVRVLRGLAGELQPLCRAAPAAEHLDLLLTFLTHHERLPGNDDPLRARLLRGRAAVLDILTTLRDAHARFDSTPVDFETVAAAVRRWIDAHTFTPYAGDTGVHVVDPESARFGEFDAVQLAGLVEGEWPESPQRNIFYPHVLLRELGWRSEAERLDGVRAAFRDLLRLPSCLLVVSTFTLEDDALVAASPLLEDVAAAGLETVERAAPGARIFEYEALAFEPGEARHLGAAARAAAARRRDAAARPRGRSGTTTGHVQPAYSLSALERYQDCPFRFFAADVLRLEEPPEDEAARSPRARGRFVHEVFQRFFEAWDARGGGTITVDCLDEARALFEHVASPMLARLPEGDAALERARLFGSAVSTGIVDVALELEASQPTEVRERWIEYRLEGAFSLGAPGGRPVSLKGVADRIDLLAGNRLRVIDYKSGYPPDPKRALQVPVYALCAQERLTGRDGAPWAVDEAAYVAFSGKRALVPVVRQGAEADRVLARARTRLLEVVDGIERGDFPPRPHEPRICRSCAFPSVCRKDYVGDGE